MYVIEKYEKISSRFVEYDSNTQIVFSILKELIQTINREVIIEHTGSSYIGIGGRNIVDILLINHNDNYQPLIDNLHELGLQTSPFNHIPKERPMMVGKISYNDKEYLLHLHLTYHNSKDHINILFFRDYLKNNLSKAKEYEEIKRNAVETGYLDAINYNNQKSTFIKNILNKQKKE